MGGIVSNRIEMEIDKLKSKLPKIGQNSGSGDLRSGLTLVTIVKAPIKSHKGMI